MSNKELLVDCSKVSLRYPRRTVFKEFDLRIFKGDRISFLGPSGCGKSTLLNIISGLLTPTSGSVLRHVAKEKISFVFQDASLFPWKTVRENLEFMAVLVKDLAKDSDSLNKRIQTVLTQVGLSERQDAYPDELSGGMKMRVALARALLNVPELLLLDEPFSALDDLTRERLQDDVLQLQRTNPSSCLILVTHNIEEAILLSERILVFGATGQVIKEYVLEDQGTTDKPSRDSVEIQNLRREIRALWNNNKAVGG